MGNVLNLPAVLNVKQSNKILHFNKKKAKAYKEYIHTSFTWWTAMVDILLNNKHHTQFWLLFWDRQYLQGWGTTLMHTLFGIWVPWEIVVRGLKCKEGACWKSKIRGAMQPSHEVLTLRFRLPRVNRVLPLTTHVTLGRSAHLSVPPHLWNGGNSTYHRELLGELQEVMHVMYWGWYLGHRKCSINITYYHSFLLTPMDKKFSASKTIFKR